jgi:hypothetical protein
MVYLRDNDVAIMHIWDWESLTLRNLGQIYGFISYQKIIDGFVVVKKDGLEKYYLDIVKP